jgi:hypothetical protein
VKIFGFGGHPAADPKEPRQRVSGQTHHSCLLPQGGENEGVNVGYFSDDRSEIWKIGKTGKQVD